ncbi:MAG: hypothetical protein KKA73_25795 [Chloroflexi bacterium]|nr:hypothetical protein [Chloroflexota bacterium]MBU1751112.1 hypothetical protein [Chloroflexota bacterium]MBU1879462.1 hypothetical protein [Chloroflexota bacterium]
MNARTKIVTIVALLVALLALLWAATSVAAQPPAQGPGGDEPDSIVSTWVHIQGRLYFHDSPVADGEHDVRFRLYPAADTPEGNYLWSAFQTVTTTNSGLFSTYLAVDQGDFDGQALWLGIKVALDDEMTPRRPILPVPYALGLRPGALVSATANLVPVLRTYNSGSAAAFSGRSIGGNGIYGQSDVEDTSKAAVYGYASEHASGVYGESVHGVGVHGKATDDAAIYAEGSIKSSAKSYIWISGNTMAAEETMWTKISTYGGAARVVISSTGQLAYVPITIPGVLYGQDVAVESVRIYYKIEDPGEDENACIVPCFLEKWSHGTGAWVRLGDNYDYHYSTTPDYFDVMATQNNVLSADEGILSLMLGLPEKGIVCIYGVRLEISHD